MGWVGKKGDTRFVKPEPRLTYWVSNLIRVTVRELMTGVIRRLGGAIETHTVNLSPYFPERGPLKVPSGIFIFAEFLIDIYRISWYDGKDKRKNEKILRK